MSSKRLIKSMSMSAAAIAALCAAPVLAQEAMPPADPATPAAQAPATPPPAEGTPTPAPAAATTPPADGAAAPAPAAAATQTVAATVAASPDHTTLAGAIRQAGLAATLAGPGPFTLFAPTNDAFTAYGPQTLASLMRPEASEVLAQILRYHVVPGALDVAALTALAEAGGGTATLTSVEGSPIMLRIDQGAVAITDERGGTIFVSEADMRQANGIIHSTNGVLFTEAPAEAAAATEPASATEPAPAEPAATPAPTPSE